MMELKDFQEKGFLQEVNRCFLHRLGLALAFAKDDVTGEVSFSGIQDERDDPEGIIFGTFDKKKAAYVGGLIEAKRKFRARLSMCNEQGIQIKDDTVGGQDVDKD